MIERFAVLVLLLAGLVLLYAAVKGWASLRRRRIDQVVEPALSDGRPTVLFFTADYCTICKVRQKPALDQLASEMNHDLRIVEVDAARDGSMLRRFGVLTLPSTVVLGPDGRVGAVNYGFAPSDQLRAQVASVA